VLRSFPLPHDSCNEEMGIKMHIDYDALFSRNGDLMIFDGCFGDPEMGIFTTLIIFVWLIWP